MNYKKKYQIALVCIILYQAAILVNENSLMFTKIINFISLVINVGVLISTFDNK